MRYTTLFEDRKNELLLVARILLMVLFLKFGWPKLTGFSAGAHVGGNHRHRDGTRCE